MPRGAWSAKRERQYEAILSSCLTRDGRKTVACKRIAAATVNKTRSRMGETKGAKMAKRKKRSVRGLGASDYAHATMAGRKLGDLDTILDNAERTSSCSSMMTHYQAGLADWGNAEAHVRSGVTKTDYPALHDRLERQRKRLVKLDGRIRQCFCKG